MSWGQVERSRNALYMDKSRSLMLVFAGHKHVQVSITCSNGNASRESSLIESRLTVARMVQTTLYQICFMRVSFHAMMLSLYI